MKKIYAILMFCFCSQYLIAQAQPEMKSNQKKLDNYLQKDKPKEFIAGHWPLKPLAILAPADTARFSHTTIWGTVYNSAIDNMPILRPDSTTYTDNQMVERVPLNGNMPNGFRGKLLVWEKRP